MLAGTLLATAATAQEIPNRKVPMVLKKLETRYNISGSMPTMTIPGTHAARDLADLVAIEQKYFPGACVTAGFYDWRTTSQYRSHAGLHLGYDIAMPYGCKFGAGWPGVVTAIAVWSGEEHGITVQSPDGTTVTYGHVSPRVTVGQQIVAGQPLGVIARDHVDVKMRDAAGNYQDYGGTGRVLPAPTWAAATWAPVAPSRETLMAEWLMASNNYDMAKQELDQFVHTNSQRKLEREQLLRRLPALKKSVAMMAQYVDQGLVARVTVEENRDELEKAKERLKKLDKDVSQDSGQLKTLQANVSAAQERLNTAKSQARTIGLSFGDVERFVNATINNDTSLRKNVEAYKRAAATKNASQLAKVESDLRENEKSLKSLEELYEIGGVAKNDLASAREKHRMLMSHMRALRAQTQE
ncbi:unnamed protein product [Phaeothamnion confervicola]